MAKFLTTSGVTHHLDEIIKGAKTKLYLISPYLKINIQLKQLLNSSNLDQITIVYGKDQKLNEDDSKWIMNNSKISLYHLSNLHAKCYLNESDAIVTSLNLHEYSQKTNREMGVLANIIDDPTFYGGVLHEAEIIINSADPIKRNGLNGKSPISINIVSKTHSGYCIRTGKEIPFNPTKPLCNDAFSSWSIYGDFNYPEKYCHFSGERSNGETSFSKPILRKNWKAAKEIGY